MQPATMKAISQHPARQINEQFTQMLRRARTTTPRCVMPALLFAFAEPACVSLYESFTRAERAIDAHLVQAGMIGYAIKAYRLEALVIKKRGGGLQNRLARVACRNLAAARPLFVMRPPMRRRVSARRFSYARVNVDSHGPPHLFNSGLLRLGHVRMRSPVA